MSANAFRVGDVAACPQHGAAVALPSSGTVLVNGRPLRTVGAPLACADGSQDKVASGASRVMLGWEYVTRLGERTQHGAQLVGGSSNVVIGSPSASGCTGAMKKLCVSMRKGRNPPPAARNKDGARLEPHTRGQSYDNCGIECLRQVLHLAAKTGVSQEELFYWMSDHGYTDLKDARNHPDQLYENGGTIYLDRQAALNEWGIPAETQENDLDHIVKGVEEGKGVVARVYADTLWPEFETNEMPTGRHAILVTGVERDEQGRIVSVVINDTGKGTCGQRVPAAKFERALIAGPGLVVTKNPIW